MIELQKEEYKKVLPLLADLNGIYLFAEAVVELNQSGHIFVNNKTNPSCCLIVNCCGSYLVSGDERDSSFNDWLFQFLKDRSKHLNFFDLSLSSQKWLQLMSNLLDGYAVKLSRTVYDYYTDDLTLPNIGGLEIPENFTLKYMDEELYGRFLQEVNPYYEKSWGSFKEFSSKGFGFCLLENDKFVSVCTSDYVASVYAGIDIETMYEYRKQGFATITCSAFIKHCLQNNLVPRWNADSGNELSNKLAIKLGFNKVKNYDMLWWHENKEVIEDYLKRFNYVSK
jgi:RimJ/RimL family protein N-acetyltransferase